METASLRRSVTAHSAKPCSDQSIDLLRSSAHTPVRSQPNRLVEWLPVKPCQRRGRLKACFDTMSRREILFARPGAKSAPLLIERLKARTITTMSHCVSDGSVARVMSDGTRQSLRTPQSGLRAELILARWEKFTGKQAVLLGQGDAPAL